MTESSHSNPAEKPSSREQLTLAELLDTVKMVANDDGESYAGTAHFTADWAQGRAMYGGVAAAVLLHAMRAHVPYERQLRSLMVSFVGPIAADEVELEVRVLREGRSASQLEAKIYQMAKGKRQVMTAVQAAFGGDRVSSVKIDSPPMPNVPAPEKGIEFPRIPGVTPAFTQHLDYRITRGRLPFMQAPDAKHGGWLKFKSIEKVPTEQLIVALADAFPPAALQLLHKPAPASSLTWGMDFTDEAASCDPEGWWYLQASAEAAADGYNQQQSYLWSPAGQLAVFDYQTVAVFD